MTTPIPANPNNHPNRYSPFWFRFFEILPGAVVWAALISPFIISFYYPLAVTLFILIFDVYWLVQTLNYSYVLIKGYYRLKKNFQTDWKQKLGEIENLPEVEREKLGIIDWREIYQTVILTTYKEDIKILEASIESIVATGYAKERLILVLATEERDAENARNVSTILQKKYGHHFFRFIVTEHPDGIVGEVKAKGANASWAAKHLAHELRELGIAYDRVIVSTADADSRFSVPYFDCLSYAYSVLPDRVQCSFQPIATYFNNIWDTPMISRVLAFGTTFWQIIESVREYRLITFATHAVSLQTLVDINYWSTSIVNEDSRQYFRSFFHYNGKFRVVPLFMPIYMDAVNVDSYFGTMRNLYLQQQRWAYGVEHFPYIVLESTRRPEIPLLDRAVLIWRAFLGTFSWATSSFFVSIVGWIPILFNPLYRDQVVVSNFIFVTQSLLSLTWVGLIVSGVITVKILQIFPHKFTRKDYIAMAIQYIMTPISGAFFGALPGLDAQTRLMLGKYIGFRVTEKKSQ